MFTKTAIALVLLVGTASAALTAPKKTYRTDPTYRTDSTHDVYVNGRYVGSDPDPSIRSTLARDPTGGD